VAIVLTVGAVLKKIVVLVVIGIAALLVYRWANPPPDEYEGLPDWFRRDAIRAEKQVREDMAGDLGHGAVALCRARLGIKEPVQTGTDLINRGYGSDRAIAFLHCVVDLMYPVPNKQ
jgi:hypothetical protein